MGVRSRLQAGQSSIMFGFFKSFCSLLSRSVLSYFMLFCPIISCPVLLLMELCLNVVLSNFFQSLIFPVFYILSTLSYPSLCHTVSYPSSYLRLTRLCPHPGHMTGSSSLLGHTTSWSSQIPSTVRSLPSAPLYMSGWMAASSPFKTSRSVYFVFILSTWLCRFFKSGDFMHSET